ncbi:MAG: hypothetical protein ACI8RZ_002148 [Myxococcota bacterium]|jgi:hypothetical protein
MIWLLTGCFITQDDREEVMDNDEDGFYHADLGGVPPELVDCNDNNDDIHPGAFENCEDEVDSDCDGHNCIPQITHDLLDAAPTLWGSPGDNLTARLALVHLDASDTTPELVLSAPGASDGMGRVYLLPDPTSSLSEAVVIEGTIEGGALQVGGSGDVDGDGDDELFLSNLSLTEPTTYVIDDWAGGSAEIVATFTGAPQTGKAAIALSEFALNTGVIVLGDPDGDGYNNMLVLGPLEADSGRAYLLSQSPSDSVDLTDGSTPGLRATFVGALDENLFGGGSQTGFDHNCDGVVDALLVAPNFNLLEADGEPILEEIGAVYGFDGDSQGSIDATDADFVLYGSYSESHIEWAADLGDTNGDGCSDLGVFFHAGAGDLGVFLGSTDPDEGLMGENYSADGVLKLFGDDGGTPTEEFGYGTIGNIDIDEDGRSDIMLGAPQEGSLNPVNGVVSAGAAYLYFGPISGVSNPEHARGHWLGGLNEGRLGTPDVGDADGNGVLDLLLSAPGASQSAESHEGAIYILYDAFEELL